MYEISDHSPAYIHSISGYYTLPRWMYDLIREDAIENDYKMLDYMDGDFKYVIDLQVIDPTPISELVKFQVGEEGYDETTYPHKTWIDEDDEQDFDKYIQWQIIAKHIRENVPEHVIATNLFAVQI